MAACQISRTTIIAILVATTAAHFARSWLQIELVKDGMSRTLAADISFLIVPPILTLLLFPLWRTDGPFLKHMFRRQDLSWTLAIQAFAIGVLIRVAWWSQLIAGASFGINSSSNPAAVVGPNISFQCAQAEIVILGFLVMAILVPIIEETVHRGYIQTAIESRGFMTAVIVSSLVFVVFHHFSSWPFVFLAGFILGTQYWITRSLWASLITHATVNGMIQVDWRCFSIQWNPGASDLPLLTPGLFALGIFVLSLAALTTVLYKMATEASISPR
jgi:membrane protease YdiL (CAAX protease family)